MKDKKPSLHRKNYNKKSPRLSNNHKLDDLSLNKIKLPKISQDKISISNTSLNKILERLNIDNQVLSDIPPKTILLVIIVLLLLTIFISTINVEPRMTESSENPEQLEKIQPVRVMLGNNSLGSVFKDGPYGNTSSNVTIAYILGVHPRENGAHKLMEDSFMQEESGNMSYCYYIYRVNVTQNPTDFKLSRMNGQLLAQEFVVPDIINNSFNLAVDCHYSDGSWGVSRFIFTPDEDNLVSSQVGHGINDSFDWITYYVPPNPTSPSYVTGPLNQAGIPALIYEAYTYDENNTTMAHDKQLINYIDSYNFTQASEI